MTTDNDEKQRRVDQFSSALAGALDQFIDGASLQEVVAAQIIAGELTGKLTLTLGRMARRGIVDNPDHAARLDRAAKATSGAHKILRAFLAGALPWLDAISPKQGLAAKQLALRALSSAGWIKRVAPPSGGAHTKH